MSKLILQPCKLHDLTNVVVILVNNFFFVHLFIEHRLFSLNSELFLMPPLLKLHLVIVHHIISFVKISLDVDTLPHNVLHPVIAGQTSPDQPTRDE